jgi:hypothetical protein
MQCASVAFFPHPSQITTNNNIVCHSLVVDVNVRIPCSENQVYRLIDLRLTESLKCSEADISSPHLVK